MLGDVARVVDILNGAAATLHLLGHALSPGKTALVPELHSQANDRMTLGAQHSRDGRRIHSSRHGYGNGRLRHRCIGMQSQQQARMA